MTITEIHPQPDHQPDQQAPVSVEAARGEELRWVDPRELILSDNVRTDVALDKGFIADVAERGVRQPVPVRPDESGRLVVRTGQRRVLAAIEAGLDRVRVLVEDETLTDERAQAIDRILDQLGENEHRSDLGEADEARATQQLLGLGLSARQIARRRHLPIKRVTTAAVVAQNPLALDAVTEGVFDLAQAAVVAEFTDDQAAVTTLTSAARTRPEQFSHVAQRLRDDREETRLRAQLTATLTEQGVTIIDRPSTLFDGTIRRLADLRATPDTTPGTELTAQDHAGCPGHAAFLDDRNSWRPVAERVAAVWVCTDFVRHGHAERHTALGVATTGKVTGAGMTEEQKTERRTVIANNKAWESATTVRRDWLRKFLTRSAAPKDALRWIAATLAQGSHDVRKAMESDHPMAMELLGLKHAARGYARRSPHAIATAAVKASPGRATVLTVAMLIAALEQGTDRRAWRCPTDDHLAYFGQLRSWGYPLSDVEMLVLTAGAPDPAKARTDDTNPDQQAEAQIIAAPDTDPGMAA
ncbi:MAG: ParB/RepB/Spo0J family partition protein [Pseudonocardiaceae bacterium]